MGRLQRTKTRVFVEDKFLPADYLPATAWNARVPAATGGFRPVATGQKLAYSAVVNYVATTFHRPSVLKCVEMKKSSSIPLTFSLTFCFIVAQADHVQSVNNSHCDRVLRRDHLSSSYSWNNANQCRLKSYRTQDVVQCFDSDGATRFHVAFIGDSRTRQQFFSLLKVIENLK